MKRDDNTIWAFNFSGRPPELHRAFDVRIGGGSVQLVGEDGLLIQAFSSKGLDSCRPVDSKEAAAIQAANAKRLERSPLKDRIAKAAVGDKPEPGQLPGYPKGKAFYRLKRDIGIGGQPFWTGEIIQLPKWFVRYHGMDDTRIEILENHTEADAAA